MITKKLDDKIKLTAKTVNVQIGQEVKVILKLFDKNKKVLAQKEYEEKVQENTKVEKNFTILSLADELKIDSSKVKYVSGWIDVDNNEEITREYEKEVWIEVEEEKKKLHFLFYTLTGSKNDEIFIQQVNLKEKIIKENKNYNNKIDIVYKKEVKTSSEILKFVKNKIKENSDNIKVEVKTVELFAELFKEKKGHKKETHIDTSNHWINNLAQPYIPNDMNIEEARNIINNNIKRKDYLNKIYEENQEEFLSQLKSGTIRGLGHVENFCTVAFLSSPPIPHSKVFFAIVGGISNYIKSRLAQEDGSIYITKLGLNTTLDIFIDGDKRLSIANELFVKPYLTYIVDNISKDKNEKRYK
ncbi:hypothetical protein AMOL_0814 [Malaciobacter molluscorum LMG 25693]|uniref:Uncharacterized protein n=2 Tax=Malaciobacter molluscorum LMG 25693 TaxID=870501 RepID=A0AB33GPW1_9BACT|nr:hypothetical protein [Malaciobacter molluscorum]AXX91809.1 hypothetical protein AMOL_0814 [Malaciobacter molluscorum LMG 25693]